MINEVLEGRVDQLKERTIGVSAFGRQPNYDTNEDTIVRASAMDVRKRLAQFYQEIGPDSEMRIELPSGSYVPEFCFRVLDGISTEERPEPAVAPRHEVTAPAPVSLRKPVFPRWALALLVGAFLLIALLVAWMMRRTQDPLDAFWAPFSSGNTVTLATGTSVDEVLRGDTPRANVSEPDSLETFRVDQVGFADAITLARVAAVLQSRGRKFEIRRVTSMTLDDLRKSPTVLIGAFNNPWTMRLGASLRFFIERNPDTTVSRILDRQKGSQPIWRVDPKAPYSARQEDYAIISRFTDPRLEQPVLTIAGIGRDGTTAASEFVTHSKYLEILAKAAPADWQRKNLQVVIATEVIKGNVGPPRVVATHFW